MRNKIELLSPCRNFASLTASIDAKADAVYFGVEKLNMRAASNQFLLKDIKKIKEHCRKKNVKAYLTLNSIIYNKDISLMKKICDEAKKENLDAIIASDMATINYANSIGLSVHISTQMNISNIEAVKFFSKYSDAIVLARELNLKEISKIVKTIEKEKIKGPGKELVKIEIFIHGAMCMAISGRCYMSLLQYKSSANEGKCLQACRRGYLVKEIETQKELLIDNKYIMSPKDLCCISFLDKILKTNVSILKIEGRARPLEYISTVTKTYKDAIESIKNKTYLKKIKLFENSLKKVYNRGFWNGYYLGNSLDILSKTYGSKASHKKTYIGKVTNYFSNIKVAEILIYFKNLKIEKGKEILITGSKTGIINKKINTFKIHKNNLITIPIDKKVRKNDEVYIFEKTS